MDQTDYDCVSTVLRSIVHISANPVILRAFTAQRRIMNMTISIWPNLLVYTVTILFSVLSPRITAAQEIADDILLSALKLEQPILLCGETVPVDDPQALERFEKEMLVSLGNRSQVILWLKRTTRYFPYIEQMLRENGLPDDLKYLAIAESALRMHAGSPKGAMGVWQLMPQTARKYGLVVDVNFDERRNLYLSLSLIHI